MPRRGAYAGGETSGPSYTPNCWYGLSGSHGIVMRSLSELYTFWLIGCESLSTARHWSLNQICRRPDTPDRLTVYMQETVGRPGPLLLRARVRSTGLEPEILAPAEAERSIVVEPDLPRAAHNGEVPELLVGPRVVVAETPGAILSASSRGGTDPAHIATNAPSCNDAPWMVTHMSFRPATRIRRPSPSAGSAL